MKCSKCGKEITNNSNYCEYCGTKVNSFCTLLWSQSSLLQKISIAILVFWFLFVSAVWTCCSECGVVFYSCLMMSIISTSILIAAILLKLSLDNQPFNAMQPNGEKPSFLFAFMGIGQIMTGAIKFRKVDDTWASYTFFNFLFPLFPTGCYRVKLLKSEDAIFFNQQQWNIYGSEASNWKEIAYIYDNIRNHRLVRYECHYTDFIRRNVECLINNTRKLL